LGIVVVDKVSVVPDVGLHGDVQGVRSGDRITNRKKNGAPGERFMMDLDPPTGVRPRRRPLIP
jgi:hypothetical protein